MRNRFNRFNRIRNLPLFPLVPIVPAVLIGGTFVLSLLSFVRLRRLSGSLAYRGTVPAVT